MDGLNLNKRSAQVASELIAQAPALGATVQVLHGATVIDAGVKAIGSLGAGLALARLCLADLARVQWTDMVVGNTTLPAVMVEVSQPVAACMASQYAGWQVSVEGGFAMGSGPMRAAYGHEAIYQHIGHAERGVDSAVGVLETGKLPSLAMIAYLADRCGVAPAGLTLAVARTASLAGGVQVVARSVETAMHKLHALDFDLSRVVAGVGVAPTPPVAKDDLAAIGRTNDAVLYGSRVTLYVTGDDDTLAAIVTRLPASASRDHGRPFAEIFAGHGHDFYKIDPLLFSPAAVTLQNLHTGRSHHAGQVDQAMLARSFFS